MRREIHEANRRSWNVATPAHNSHKGDQAAFFRAGGGTLLPEETELLGDVSGRALVHLQCNAGQDTLSLARLGARVTGVDISDEAVDFARRLSAESGIPATFERADVYDWLEAAAREGRRFDVAFSSYGAVSWLTDLRAWGAGIGRILAPGGRFVLVEFHPVLGVFDDDLSLRFPYSSGGEPTVWDQGVSDYVALSGEGLALGDTFEEGVKDFRNPHRAYDFQWGVGEVVQALIDGGLVIETLREYPYSNGFRPFAGMRTDPGTRRYRMPEGIPDLPLMYAVAARKPG